MKKILYYTCRDMTAQGDGINKKITEQIAVLRKFGFQVDAVYRKNDKQLFFQTEREEILITERMKRPYKVASSKYLRKYLENQKRVYWGAYIRYVYGDREFDGLLRYLKKNGSMIVVEIPTYPYDMELKDSLENRIVLFLDKMYRNKMYRYVNRIVTFSKDEIIYSIPTIRSMNGVNFDKIRMLSPDETYAGRINVIAVANLAPWHGFDRFLEGMGQYYYNGGKRNVIFHLVGDGKELEEYRKIVEKWKIQNHVIFYGRKDGAELDKIYDYCNLAIECLGLHRKDIKVSSSLKSREYLAKGLPIIASNDIDVFSEKDNPFFLKVPSEEKPVSIDNVLKFYDNIYKNRTRMEVSEQIRSFSKKICDINNAIKPIVDYYNSF